MKSLTGIPASGSIAIGSAFLHHPLSIVTTERIVTDTEAELARFRHALAEAKMQLDQIRIDAEATVGAEAASIFKAQQLMLGDPDLMEGVETQICSGANAESALALQIDYFATQLAGLQNPTLRERAADVRDVGQRVLQILTDRDANALAHFQGPVVVVAPDLSPSETVQMDKDRVLALVTARGGVTSHTAILARSLGLPAVVGLGEGLLNLIQQDTTIIVDGYMGIVIVDPDETTLGTYLARRARERVSLSEAQRAALAPASTRDGHAVEVVANIGDIESVELALAHGAEGIGLLRTEFLFLNQAAWPDEEEQYVAYRAVIQAIGTRPVVLRTLDAGGDKPLPCRDSHKETNPFLGLRAIRLSLARPEMLKTQLCAILRAGVGGHVKVMFPMITTIEEIRLAHKVLEEAKADLTNRGIAFTDEVEVGIMVEVPSAAICAPDLAHEVDFFSIGTNDLIQYTLAVDRTNERVSYLYDPLHPAVLHLISRVIVAAHQAGRWVGMCGEMASDLDAVPLLLGMGLDEFSVNAADIPNVKALIRSLHWHTTQDLAARSLELSTSAEIRALVRREQSDP